MAETFNPLKLGTAYCPDKNATTAINRNFNAVKRILDSITSGEGIPGTRIADDAIDASKTDLVGIDGTSGKIVLSQIESGDLDDIDDGTIYAKVLTTDITAGHILLSECTGNLDNITNGSSYGKVLLTDITSGHILLSTCSGDLDDITDGSTYGKVALTGITAGKIIVAGLADAVVARIFTDSTIKTNIEAWRHISDSIWLDGNNIVWLDGNNIVWLDTPSIDLTLIDGGDIYTGTITASHIAAGAITAVKINVSDLVNIANLLTVDSGKIVIGKDALGTGLGGIVINDGTRDRAKMGETASGVYRVEVFDASGVEIVDGQNKMLRWHASGEIDCDDNGNVYYEHGFDYFPMYMYHGIADAYYGVNWDAGDREFVVAKLRGGDNDDLEFNNGAGQDLYIMYTVYKEGASSICFYPRKSRAGRQSIKVQGNSTVFIYEKSTGMIKQTVISGGGEIDFFTDKLGVDRDYYVHKGNEIRGIGYLQLVFNSNKPVGFKRKPIVQFKVTGSKNNRKLKVEGEVTSKVKLQLTDTKTRKNIGIFAEDKIEKLRDVPIPKPHPGKFRISTPITNDYISEPVETEME